MGYLYAAAIWQKNGRVAMVCMISMHTCVHWNVSHNAVYSVDVFQQKRTETKAMISRNTGGPRPISSAKRFPNRDGYPKHDQGRWEGN